MPHIKGESGIEWFYDMEGEGEILIFIHGWGVDRRIWRQQFKYFSQNYKVMSFDLPGHGQSSWQKVSLEVMARDLDTIFDQLGFDQITLIGSSIGGMLGLRIYEFSPVSRTGRVFLSAYRFAAGPMGYRFLV